MMDGNNGEKTQSWALLGCLLFVFLFMCICLFEKDKSDKVWRAANQTFEQNMWKVHWLTQAMAFERFCSYHYFDFFNISAFAYQYTYF